MTTIGLVPFPGTGHQNRNPDWLGTISTMVLIVLFLSGPASAVPLTSHDPWLPFARLSDPVFPPVKGHAFCDVGWQPICGNAESDFGTAVALDTAVAVVGHPEAKAVHFYESTGIAWDRVATFAGPAGFGKHAAIHGDLAVVSAPDASEFQIFHHASGGWQANTTVSLPGEPCIRSPVDIHGERIAISVPCTSTILVYDWDGAAWSETLGLAIPEVRFFGLFIDLTADTLFAASPDTVFALDAATEWTPTVVAQIASRQIAADGGRLATATSREVIVLDKAGDTWAESARLVPTDASPFDTYDDFGYALALRGDTAVVSAREDDGIPGTPSVDPVARHPCASSAGTVCAPPKPGAAYVFERENGAWQQTAKLVGDPVGDDRFGYAVGLAQDANTLLVGTPGKTTSYLAGNVDLDVEDSVQVFIRGGA